MRKLTPSPPLRDGEFAWIKFQTKCARSLLELSWMVKETILVRRPLIDILSLTPQSIVKFSDENHEPLTLF